MKRGSLKVWVGLLLVGLLSVVSCQHRERHRLLSQVRELQGKLTENPEASDPTTTSIRSTSFSGGGNQSAELRELLRLRGEVALLRRQAAEMTQDRVTSKEPVPASPSITNWGRREVDLESRQRMAEAQEWWGAMQRLIKENNGQLPLTGNGLPMTGDKFETVYENLQNQTAAPESVIVVRERVPQPRSDGGWSRAYVFADGHAEVHNEKQGNFYGWEKARMKEGLNTAVQK